MLNDLVGWSDNSGQDCQLDVRSGARHVGRWQSSYSPILVGVTCTIANGLGISLLADVKMTVGKQVISGIGRDIESPDQWVQGNSATPENGADSEFVARGQSGTVWADFSDGLPQPQIDAAAGGVLSWLGGEVGAEYKGYAFGHVDKREATDTRHGVAVEPGGAGEKFVQFVAKFRDRRSHRLVIASEWRGRRKVTASARLSISKPCYRKPGI